MSERPERCETCRFWDGPDYETDTGHPVGQCRRNAPRFIEAMLPPGDCIGEPRDAVWAATLGHDWCGEWRAKDDNQPGEPKTLPVLLSVYDAADRLRINPIRMRKLARAGEFDCIETPDGSGKTDYLFTESALAQWLARQTKPAQNPPIAP